MYIIVGLVQIESSRIAIANAADAGWPKNCHAELFRPEINGHKLS
jgi:hypothetical protein